MSDHQVSTGRGFADTGSRKSPWDKGQRESMAANPRPARLRGPEAPPNPRPVDSRAIARSVVKMCGEAVDKNVGRCVSEEISVTWRPLRMVISWAAMTITPRSARPSLSLAVLFVAVVVSLGSSSHPSINAAAKADLDRRIGALQPNPRSVPPPTVAEPLPLAVGQWITFKQVDSENRPSITTYKIVGEQDGAYWYEMSIDSYYGHTAMRMLLSVGNRRDPATM